MLIGQISKQSGLSRDTIRFYEKKGLIKAKSSTSKFNDYKNYDEEVLDRLNRIKNAKSFGFTLKEIEELLTQIDAKQASCSFFALQVKAKLSSIDQQILELVNQKNRILQRIKETQNSCIPEKGTGNCGAVEIKKN